MPAPTPVFKKLQYKEQSPLLVLDAPETFAGDFLAELTQLASHQPYLEAWPTEPAANLSFVLIFVQSAAEIAHAATALVGQLTEDPLLWIAYPKKASKRYRTDISRDKGWEPMGELGYEPVRQVAIDEDWSALRFRPVDHIKQLTRRDSMLLSKEGRQRKQGS